MQAVLRYFGTAWNVRLFWSRETLPGGGAAERRKVCPRGNALWGNRICNSVISAGLCYKINTLECYSANTPNGKNS